MTPFLSYNNLVFPSNFTSSPRSRFQYDRSGRTVAHTVHTITASYKTVAPLGDGIDAYVLLVRQMLSKSGMPLRYIGSGAGGLLLNINVNGPQDVVWGPKPQALNVKPLGGGNAVIIEWTVEVAIPDCSNASFQGIAEANNNITYGTTEISLVIRTMEYQVRIASRRSATGRGLLDSPDNYLPAIIPPVIPGFRRSFGPRHINDAKDTVSGTVVDEQMGGVYPPPYVTKWKMDARMSAKGAAGIKWFGTITADYTTAVNCPDLSIPAQHFWSVVVKDRVGKLATSLLNDPATRRLLFGDRGRAGILAPVMPLEWTMREPDAAAPERRFEFSFSYWFTCALSSILSVCGLWRQIPGTDDWQGWATSLTPSAFAPLGYIGLQFNPQDDSIVDLCVGSPTGPSGFGDNTDYADLINSDTQAEFFDDMIREIRPDNSWMGYDITAELRPESGSVLMRTLPATPIPNPAGTLGLVGMAIAGGLNGVMDVLKNPLPPSVPGSRQPTSPGSPNPVFPNGVPTAGTQQRVADTWRVVIRGSARRAMYAVPMPLISQIGALQQPHSLMRTTTISPKRSSVT